jgi:hypothetical protein
MTKLLQTIKKNDKRFIEKGADLEHDRWAGWQKYLFGKCEHKPYTENGSLTIPSFLVKRWQRQIDTPYENLSEQEKESDRNEVRKYLPLLKEMRIKELEALVEIERDINNDLDEHFSACNECMPSGSGGVCNKYSELRGYKQALADIIEILKRK